MKIIKRTEHPFPEDPEERLARTLLVINTELKCATIECLSPTGKTSREIRSTYQQYFRPGDWVPSHATFAKLCHRTLVPTGYVAEEEIEERGTTWRLTEAGERYAKPVARFTLTTSANMGISMYQILGQTSSPGKSSAPYNRVRILEELYFHDKLRKKDLEEFGGVQYHLEALRDVGLISYDSISSESSGWSTKNGPAESESHPMLARLGDSLDRLLRKLLRRYTKARVIITKLHTRSGAQKVQ